MQRVPERINPRRNMPKYILIKLSKMKYKEKILKATREKYCRRRNTSKLILRGHHHPDTNTRQRCHKERKLQANITDEYRCKSPEQDTSKQNPTT